MKSSLLLPQTIVKHYKIIREISRGGMGVVYLCQDLKVQRNVALKIILVDDVNEQKILTKRFIQEVKIVAHLNYPNIAKIYDYGVYQGVPYFVMEYIEGMPILEYVQRFAKDNFRVQLNLMLELAKTLSYIHSKRIIHRDIKPSNILVRKNGKPVLLDFGLAKLYQSSTKLTQIGMIIGSLYMSPEQAKDEREKINARSDIYSLGAVFYEMTTGCAPVQGENMIQVLNDIIYTSPPLPSSVNPKVPKVFDVIISKAMAKDYNARYFSSKILANDLDRILNAKARKSQKRVKSNINQNPQQVPPNEPKNVSGTERQLHLPVYVPEDKIDDNTLLWIFFLFIIGLLLIFLMIT